MVALLAALTIAATGPYVAEIHGVVRSVDRAHNLLVVHHQAHAGMAMEMTMAVKMKDPRELAGLRPGQTIKLRCDERRNPWVCVKG